MKSERIDALHDILDAERVALLDGDLDQVGKLVAQKETLIDELRENPPENQNALGPLQAKITRNQALLDGALMGIRRVAKRMATLRSIRKSMDTYDAEGRKQTIPGVATPKVERRA